MMGRLSPRRLAISSITIFVIVAVTLAGSTITKTVHATTDSPSSSRLLCAYAGAAILSDRTSGIIYRYPEPQNVSGREMSVDVAIAPYQLSSTRQDNVTISFRLCDIANGETIPNVYYSIEVSKLSGDESTLFADFIYSPNGTVVLRSYEETEKAVAVKDAKREDFLGAWLADPANNNTITMANLMSSGGIYHFNFTIIGIGERNLLPPPLVPSFEYVTFIQEAFPQNVSYAGRNYNVTLVSSFNQPQNFTFDVESGIISWSMPFDWNISSLENLKGKKWSVEQHIVFDNSSFALSSVDPENYSLTVNGMPLEQRWIVIPVGTHFAEPAPALIVWLNIHHAISIAEQMAPEGQEPPETMDFVVTTNQNVRIVPEFGSVAAMSVTAATIGALIAANRFRANKL